VSLLDAKGLVVDSMLFELPGPDESLSRGEDGEWHAGWTPTPGEENEEPAGLLKRTRPLPATATPAARRRP